MTDVYKLDEILKMTKQLRHLILPLIPLEGSKETIPEQRLLEALILYEKRKART